MDINNPIWNITEPQVQDNSIEKYDFYEIREQNVNVRDLKKYEFICKDTGNYILPSQSYLHLRFKVIKADGSDISDATDNVTVSNNGFNLFSSAEYEIDKTKIEQIDHLGIKTLVENLVDYSDDYSKSTASNQFWFPDTADSADRKMLNYWGGDEDLEVDATTNLPKLKSDRIKSFLNYIRENKEFNKGYLARYILTKKSKVVSLFLPLNRIFGFCKYINRVFVGVQHTLRFTKNDVNNAIVTSDNGPYDVSIEHLSLFMAYAQPSLATKVQLEKILASNREMELLWLAGQVYRSEVRDDKDLVWKITTTQFNPVRLYVMFQIEQRENNPKSCNMVFDHMNLKSISAVLNDNLRFPSNEYECNFEAESLDYARVYQSFLSAGYKNVDHDTGTIVSYQDFMRLYPIFHVDLSRKPENLFESRNTVDIGLKVKLGNYWTNKYRIYCLLLSERKAILNPTDQRTIISVR